MTAESIRIGISSCLLGEPVRYDGGHKRDAWISDSLSQHVEFHPICPEVAIGLGVPRAPIQLVRVNGAVRVRGVSDPGQDFTERLANVAECCLPELTNLSGYIFKSKSPSCGAFRVKVYDERGQPDGYGEGAFAAAVKAAMPLLPVEEEGRLSDPRLRESFVTRVYVYHRWRQLRDGPISAAALAAFHSDHQCLVMAHNQAACRRLDRLVAAASEDDVDSCADKYIRELMNALVSDL